MKKIAFALVGAASLALAACGGKGDDSLGENVQENYENAADNLDAMVEFYELLTATTAVRPAPVFAEIVTATATLAIGSAATVPLFAPGSAEPAANRSAILEFLVSDVDSEYARLAASGMEFVAGPALMPWGNRVFFVRDPDHNLLEFISYAPDDVARYQRDQIAR